MNFDNNKDGKLSASELKLILGTSDNELINELISNIDKNNDGEISYQEFSDLMKEILKKKTYGRQYRGSKSMDIRKYATNVFLNAKESVKTFDHLKNKQQFL